MPLSSSHKMSQVWWQPSDSETALLKLKGLIWKKWTHKSTERLWQPVISLMDLDIKRSYLHITELEGVVCPVLWNKNCPRTTFKKWALMRPGCITVGSSSTLLDSAICEMGTAPTVLLDLILKKLRFLRSLTCQCKAQGPCLRPSQD